VVGQSGKSYVREVGSGKCGNLKQQTAKYEVPRVTVYCVAVITVIVNSLLVNIIK
jgi:hypothetical protein